MVWTSYSNGAVRPSREIPAYPMSVPPARAPT